MANSNDSYWIIGFLNAAHNYLSDCSIDIVQID